MGPQGAQGESDRARVSTLKVEFLKSAHVGPVDAFLPWCLAAVLPQAPNTASGTFVICHYL